MIGVSDFWLIVLDLCLDDFEIRGHLIDKNSEINQLLLEQAPLQEVGCSWRGVVSGKHYSHS